ncbi:hypothetical protein HDU84_006618 [Entophlyctis sp. JEL0112]|nr:hypothetical protein HDU84_006618 [Entophlyctis sp. JEL0112]
MAFQQCTGGTFISKFDILPRDKLLTRELEDPGQIVFAYPGVNSVQIADGESYFGFIDDEVDALIVIEATIIALLKPFPGTAAALTNLRVRSGSVFVIPESSQFARRWVDGLQWSPSRAYGSFLLYRQIEKVNEHKTGVESRSNEGGRAISGVAPTFSKKSLKAGTQIIMDVGLTIRASDAQNYRVISYFSPSDIANDRKSSHWVSKCTCRPSDDPLLGKIAQTDKFRQALGDFHNFRKGKHLKKKLRSYDRSKSHNFGAASKRMENRLHQPGAIQGGHAGT